MSSNRRYQLERLASDIAERFRFNVHKLDIETPDPDPDEDELTFHAGRAIRLHGLLTKVRSRLV